MKKILVISLMLFFSATSCSVYFEPVNKYDRNDPLVDFDVSDPEGEGSSDGIAVTSITPDSGLIAGDSYTFTIDITYNLASLEEGAVIITFNHDAMDVWSSPDSGSEILLVSQGSETVTFTVVQSARDWGSDGSFSVAATLSAPVYDEITGSYTYNGIVTDYQVLTFE